MTLTLKIVRYKVSEKIMVTGRGFELFENFMDGHENLGKFQLNFPDPVTPINNEWSLRLT